MKPLFRADLHCHSTYSDGTDSPSELIHLAKEKGLQGLSITDHDTIAAYDEAIPIAIKENFPLISGAEFSAQHFGQSVHILAYSFSTSSNHIKTFCNMHFERRQKRFKRILEKLAAAGMQLSDADFADQNFQNKSCFSIGRPHIAWALMRKGFVGSIQEAFYRYLSEGKPCFVPGEMASVEETIEVIHKAQGFAVIAHPHLIRDRQIWSALLDMNFDGIEGYYARFSSSEQDRWVKIGMNKGLIVTGGSDYHGSIKPNLSLGTSWVQNETFSILLERFNQNQTLLSPAP